MGTVAIPDNSDFAGLTLFRSGSQWQASLQREAGGAYHVVHAPTIAEAFAQLFPVTASPPPPPY